jgi:hypothetical protein
MYKHFISDTTDEIFQYMYLNIPIDEINYIELKHMMKSAKKETIIHNKNDLFGIIFQISNHLQKLIDTIKNTIKYWNKNDVLCLPEIIIETDFLTIGPRAFVKNISQHRLHNLLHNF